MGRHEDVPGQLPVAHLVRALRAGRGGRYGGGRGGLRGNDRSSGLRRGGGGALYTVGAVIYATRRPDPFPRVFGYHEIFHALVVAAAALHFTVAMDVVRALGV